MLVFSSCVAVVPPETATDTGQPPAPVTSPATPGGIAGWDLLEVTLDGANPTVVDLAITTDGGLCVVGIAYPNPTTSEWTPKLPTFVLRISADGAPDLAFGVGGWLILEGSGPAEAVAPGPDGSCWVMSAANLDGLPDEFGPTTFARIEADGTTSAVGVHPRGEVKSLVTAPDGTLLALTYDARGAWVRRFGADGARDRSYGEDGVAALPIRYQTGVGFGDWGAVRLLPGGGAVAGGSQPAVVAKLDRDGILDAGSGGAVTSAGAFQTRALALAPGGAVMLGGSLYDEVLGWTVPAVEPIDPTGTLSPAVFPPVDERFDVADLARGPDGDLWMAGTGGGFDPAPALMRLRLTDGGWVADAPTLYPSYPAAWGQLTRVQVDADGTVVAAGTHYTDPRVVLVVTAGP